MKTYKIYLANIICMLSLLACTDDATPVLTHIEPSRLNNLPSQNYVLEEPAEGENPLLFTATWSRTTFNFDGNDFSEPAAPVTYKLEIDKFGNNFDSAQVLSSTTDQSIDIFVADLNNVVVTKLGISPNERAQVELRIVAVYGENSAGTVISANTLPFYVTPYAAQNKMPAIFIIGDMNGWNNTNTDYIMFRNSNKETDGVYTYTGYFGNGTDGAYFKFCAEENLGSYDNMFCAGEGGVLELGDTGAFFAGPGFYTVTIDIINMTWTLNPFDASAATRFSTLGPIGEFCGWDNEPLMTNSTYDFHQWRIGITFDASTTCKFRGNRNWSFNWGGDAADIPYGKGVFDGPGASVKAGNYTIYFNDLTGHYAIINRD